MYTILLALLLVGEALALWAGMHLFSNGSHVWVSRKNNAYLLLDVLCGVLLFLGWAMKLPENIFWAAFIIVAASHFVREYEYLTLQQKAFCNNLPLFLMNNIKIVLSMSTAVIHLTFL